MLFYKSFLTKKLFHMETATEQFYFRVKYYFMSVLILSTTVFMRINYSLYTSKLLQKQL